MPARIGSEVVWKARLDALTVAINSGESMRNAAIAAVGYEGGYRAMQARYPVEIAALLKVSALNEATRMAARHEQRETIKRERLKGILERRGKAWMPAPGYKCAASKGTLQREAMLALRGCGWTLALIGELFGVTREWVRQQAVTAASHDFGGKDEDEDLASTERAAKKAAKE